jgi:hypothetical protein
MHGIKQTPAERSYAYRERQKAKGYRLLKGRLVKTPRVRPQR